MREITVDARDRPPRTQIIAAVEPVDGAELIEVTDRTFEVHRGGKIHTGLNSSR